MRAIDFRLRPPYKTYLNSFMYDMPALEKSHAMRNLGEISEEKKKKDTALLVEEMDKAGVVLGVAPVRLPQDGDNDDAERLMKEFPNHFLGVPWVDPLNPKEACSVIEKYCVMGSCRAIIMEPGLYTTPVKWLVNNPDIYPVYEYCEEKRRQGQKIDLRKMIKEITGLKYREIRAVPIRIWVKEYMIDEKTKQFMKNLIKQMKKRP